MLFLVYWVKVFATLKLIQGILQKELRSNFLLTTSSVNLSAVNKMPIIMGYETHLSVQIKIAVKHSDVDKVKAALGGEAFRAVATKNVHKDAAEAVLGPLRDATESNEPEVKPAPKGNRNPHLQSIKNNFFSGTDQSFCAES